MLRALGFGRSHIVITFLIESTALALAGALLGIALALITPSLDFATTNFATGQEVLFRFIPSVEILCVSLMVGAMMGVLGGLLPALGAARISPIQAMRV